MHLWSLIQRSGVIVKMVWIYRRLGANPEVGLSGLQPIL